MRPDGVRRQHDAVPGRDIVHAGAEPRLRGRAGLPAYMVDPGIVSASLHGSAVPQYARQSGYTRTTSGALAGTRHRDCVMELGRKPRLHHRQANNVLMPELI